MLVAANTVATSTTGPGAGFTSRIITSPDGDIVEDQTVTATGSYQATAPLSAAGPWVMQMATFSASSSGDTTPPTAPSYLTATAASASQINLAWTASTDNVGVTGYLVERCSGAGCTNFAQIGTPTSTSFSDTGLTASTSYSYRVRATDAAGNLSAYSNTASATTTGTTGGTIKFIQGNYAVPSSATTVTVTFTAAQTAGNLNVVVVGWNDTTHTVSSVTDSSSNTYVRAVGPTVGGGISQSIYYAKSIAGAAANANTVTVTFSAAATAPDIRILEYSGLNTTAPLDVTAAASGSGTSVSSGSATTTSANELILGATTVSAATSGVGSGFTKRIQTVPDSDLVEDQIVTATGSYAATSTVTGGTWVAQMATFSASALAGDTTPPTAPSNLTATAASASQINLAWTASTDNVGVTGYLVERCSGAGCTNFAQIGTPTSTSFSDTGLTANTSYSYRVRATDAAGNLSAYSNIASATTSAGQDTTATDGTVQLDGDGGERQPDQPGMDCLHGQCRGHRLPGGAMLRGRMHQLRPDRHPHEHELFRHGPDGQHQLQLSSEGNGRGRQPQRLFQHRHCDHDGHDGRHHQVHPGQLPGPPILVDFGRRHLHRRPVRR